MTLRRALVATALGIATLDLAQVLLLDWRPKHVGALGGAAIYLLVAWGVSRDRRAAAIVAAGMPVIPLSVLALWATGAQVPVAPDGPMLRILALQLLAAVLAVAWLRAVSRPAE